MHKITITTLLLSLPIGLVAAAPAQEDRPAEWRLCPSDRDLPPIPRYTDDDIVPGSTEIRADSTRIVEDGITYFSGNVELVRDEQALRGDVVTYDNVKQLVNIEGNAHLWNPGLTWQGEAGLFDLAGKFATLEGGRYWLTDRRGRGLADAITHDDNENISRLSGVDYTTCPQDRPDWKFSAKSIKLNHDTDRGSATHVLLKIRNVPVLYAPYINFPLSDKRKSGFLIPTFGTSNESGADVRIPYYWNIAPNHDATLTPRYLADRGAMLNGEYRYLYQDFEGELDFEYLPDDDLEHGKDRSLVSFRHLHYFGGRRGHASILFSNVSDGKYFEDFGQSINVTSRRFLDRHLKFRYQGRRWGLIGRVQDYQSIDDSLPPQSSPYKRLPSIYFWGTLPQYHRHLRLSFSGDTTYFTRGNSVSGGRIDLEPAVSFPLIKTYGRIVPRIGLRHTEYLLDQSGPFDDRENRTLPIVTVDSYLFAERQFSAFGAGFLQTLEPRAFYLLIPNEGQNDIPVFDSGLFDVSYLNLFRRNRFTGRDRVGDANQLALGLSSRTLDRETGREVFRASVGQMFFFRDRKVTLPGGSEQTDDLSEFIGEIAARISNTWWIRGALQFDPNDSDTDKSVLALRYNPAPGTILNLGYRLVRSRTVTDVEQTDISFRWPLTDALSVVGRWNYSLRTNESLEAMGGIEYESCCWGIRLVTRRFLRNTEGQFENAMFVQLELKGLGGYGRGTASFLRKSIAGYEELF
jgi:LPS-assembly protein